MQNLVVKLLVLSGVIGGSCFVVWQAHEGLMSASNQLDLGEFVSLPTAKADSPVDPDEPDSSARSAEQHPATEHPATEQKPAQPRLNLARLNLAEQSLAPAQTEPVPTLAKLPAQSEESDTLDPKPEFNDPLAESATANAGTDEKKSALEKSEFPLFLTENPKDSDSSESNPTPAKPSHKESPGKERAEMALKSSVSEHQFLALPDQQVELPESNSKPLDLTLEERPEEIAGKSDFPAAEKPNVRRFGPITQVGAEIEAPADAPTQSEPSEEEMSGLTRLPPSHPGPVLLPVDAAALPQQPSEKKPSDKKNSVVTADGVESELESPRTVSDSILPDSVLPDSPREFVPGQTAPSMPKELPEATPVAATPRQLPQDDPFGSDPFGLPSAPKEQPKARSRAPENHKAKAPGNQQEQSKEQSEAQVLPDFATLPESSPSASAPQKVVPEEPAKKDVMEQPSVLPEAGTQSDSTIPKESASLPEASELPKVLPAGGIPPASAKNAEKGKTVKEFGVQQTGGELPATSLPPLPPADEVLPAAASSGSEQTSFPKVSPLGIMPKTPKQLPRGDVETGEDGLLRLSPQNEVLPTLKATGPGSIPPTPAGPGTVERKNSQPVSTQSPLATAPAHLPDSHSQVLPRMQPANAPAQPENQLIGTAEVQPNIPPGPQSPELKIEKIAPSDAEVGEPVVYAILVRNVGGSEAHDVVVEDRIPRGSQLEGTIPQAYLNEGKLSWQLGTMKPGEEHKIQLKVIPTEAGQIGSVATVSFASAVSASIKVTAPKLTLSMTGPSEAVVGEVMNFRFVLKNEGQGAGKSVYLRTILPPGLNHPGGNDLEYEAGTIPPGDERVINLAITPDRQGVFTIHSQVSNDGKTQADTQADVSVIKSRIKLTRTGPENRFVGRPAKYTLKVTNTSSQPLKNVTIQEKIAPGVELAAIPGGGRWDPRRRLITWKLEELAVGQSREIHLLYVAAEAGEHAGVLVAVDEAGNRCELTTNLSVKGFADLTPDLNADRRNVLVGERISLKMSLKNAGTAAAKNMRVQFILPDGVQFSAARGPVDYVLDGNLVTFKPLDKLMVNAVKDFHLAVTAKEPGTSKITMKLAADDYSEPVIQEQAIRVIGN